MVSFYLAFSLACTLTFYLTLFLATTLTFYLTYFLANTMALSLAFYPASIVTFVLASLPPFYSGNQSGILSGIYSNILSFNILYDILHAFWHCILSDGLPGIYSDILCLAFYPAFCPAFYLTFSLVCVRVQAWPAPGAVAICSGPAWQCTRSWRNRVGAQAWPTTSGAGDNICIYIYKYSNIHKINIYILIFSIYIMK